MNRASFIKATYMNSTIADESNECGEDDCVCIENSFTASGVEIKKRKQNKNGSLFYHDKRFISKIAQI
jgi:hypothetical protein